jgi:hypothetical protein
MRLSQQEISSLREKLIRESGILDIEVGQCDMKVRVYSQCVAVNSANVRDHFPGEYAGKMMLRSIAKGVDYNPREVHVVAMSIKEYREWVEA